MGLDHLIGPRTGLQDGVHVVPIDRSLVTSKEWHACDLFNESALHFQVYTAGLRDG